MTRDLPNRLNGFLDEHPEVKLIVIDVLERIRSAKTSGNKNAYQIDSAEMAKIKVIADKNEICVFLIHHTRKMKDQSDPFQRISESQGILGAVDEAFMLEKEKRMDNMAVLSIVSREMADMELVLEFNQSTCRWEVRGTLEERQALTAREEYEADPVVITIKGLLERNPAGIELSASEFLCEMPVIAKDYGGHTPTSLGKRFPKIAPLLYEYDKIVHREERNKNRRTHTFYTQVSQVSLLS